jgi:hypothetical protein
MLPFKKGNFQAGQNYMPSGKTLNGLYQGLRQRTPVAGQDIQLQEVDGGFEIHSTATAASAEATAGPFYSMFTHTDGRTYLRGGCITIGPSHTAIPDYWVIDPITGPRGPEGLVLVIRVGVSGYKINGIILPGLSMSGSASLQGKQYATAPAYPTRQQPTVSQPLELAVGIYTEKGFNPYEPGHRWVAFCPGYPYDSPGYHYHTGP